MSNNPFVPQEQEAWRGELLPIRGVVTPTGQHAVELAVPGMLEGLWQGAKDLAMMRLTPEHTLTPAAQGTLMSLAAPDVMGAGAEAAALRSFGAWHGTPHTFDEFKNEAMRTGEGAQAYGWGHYVAGNPETAETYKMAGGISPTYKGVEYEKADLGRIPWHAMTNLRENKGDIDATIAQLNRIAGNYTGEWDKGIKQDTLNMAQWLQENRSDIAWPGSGHLLEVHVLPDESEFLDWDKPLSEQPEVVQTMAKEPDIAARLPATGGTGENLYRALSNSSIALRYAEQNRIPWGFGASRNDEAASKFLHEAGIPGIKYLDQGSRAAGEGTRNYVVFDPSNLKIVGRDGQKLTPIDYNPFKVGK